MDLDLWQLMRIARRRGWLILLMMVVAATTAYLNSSRETPMYSASATMLVSPGQQTGNSDFNSQQDTERLAETYRLLATSDPMLERVESELDIVLDPKAVSSSIVSDTDLIQISVSADDPERAALVANTIVAEFTDYVAERAAQHASTARGGLDRQIQALETRLEEIDAQVAELNSPVNADDTAIQQQITDLSRERATIFQTLNDLNTTAITVETEMTTSSPQIELTDPADVPADPYAPRLLRAMLLGAFAGLILAIGVVALLEFLDNTVKPEMNIQALSGAPMLVTIASLPKLAVGSAQVFSLAQPRSSATEALRLLRTNLEFADASSVIHTLTVSSPGPGEGKSTLVANLGVVMAQAGMKVAIIDADLRKPTLHRIFSVENSQGLTTLLTHPDHEWQDTAEKVALPGLWLVPSGPLPPNPSDLLSSGRFEQLLERVKADVDLVILDSPPILSASDALAIASHTDGVVLVCQSHKTRIDALRQAAESIHHGDIRLVGVVLNRQKGQQGATYYGTYYDAASSPSD